MLRAQVKEQYKWKLEDLFLNDDAWNKEFIRLCENLDAVSKYKGKLNDANTLLSALKKIDEISMAIEKLYCYARMRRDEDSSLDLYVGLSDKAEGLVVKFNTNASFVSSELTSLSDEYILSVIADKRFGDYDFMLKEVMRNRKHILSEKEERLLSMSGASLGMFSDVFNMIDNVDLPLPKIQVDGKKVKLTHGLYSKCLQNKDVGVRKAAFKGMYGAVKSLVNTISANYSGSVKKDNFYAKARGFDSCLEKALDGDNIPVAVYDNLLSAVNDNLSSVHEYVAYRKKALNVEKLHMYDMYVPIVKGARLTCEYDEAYKLVLEGLEPLGEEYQNLLVKAKADRWIDVEETANKRSGAYSWGAYGSHPYVLLNYSKTVHDIFTIAHELGHAMHSYYSDANLPYAKAGYAIFVAEVASTVNEVLLLKHMIKSTTDKNVKKYLLSYYLDMFRTTLFRQTMFAEFEKIAHDFDSDGMPLTVKSLSDAYYELNKKYYGEAVKHDDMIRYEWARIPHFYTSFYVYKYATGLTSAVTIAKSILDNGANIENYMKFLKSGGSKSPYEILCSAGVDLATKTPYEIAMAEFEETLKELKKE